MITTLICAVLIGCILKWKHVSVSKALVSSAVTVICYIGLVALVAGTIAQSLRNQSQH